MRRHADLDRPLRAVRGLDAYHAFGRSCARPADVELNGGAARNRELVSARLANIDPELVPWAPLLAAPLDVEIESTPEVDELDPSFRRARLHGLVGSLLGTLLGSPTLLVFEDVHWMDEASSELLRHLGTQLLRRPWLTCTTRRPTTGGFAAAEGTPPLPALTLRLEPLPPEDAKRWSQAATDRELSDEDVRAITQRAAGNPLFLQELAADEQPHDQASDELPETVEALVATDRPPGAGRPCAAAMGVGARAVVLGVAHLRRARRGSLGRVRLGGLGSARGVHRARSRRRGWIPVSPCVDPGRRVRRALLSRAGASCTHAWRRWWSSGTAVLFDDAAELLSLHFLRAGRR